MAGFDMIALGAEIWTCKRLCCSQSLLKVAWMPGRLPFEAGLETSTLRIFGTVLVEGCLVSRVCVEVTSVT